MLHIQGYFIKPLPWFCVLCTRRNLFPIVNLFSLVWNSLVLDTINCGYSEFFFSFFFWWSFYNHFFIICPRCLSWICFLVACGLHWSLISFLPCAVLARNSLEGRVGWGSWGESMWGRLSADCNKQNSREYFVCVFGGGQVIFTLEIMSSQLFNQARC